MNKLRHSSCHTSPTMIRESRIRSASLTNRRSGISPAPSRLGWRVCIATTSGSGTRRPIPQGRAAPFRRPAAAGTLGRGRGGYSRQRRRLDRHSAHRRAARHTQGPLGPAATSASVGVTDGRGAGSRCRMLLTRVDRQPHKAPGVSGSTGATRGPSAAIDGHGRPSTAITSQPALKPLSCRSTVRQQLSSMVIPRLPVLRRLVRRFESCRGHSAKVSATRASSSLRDLTLVLREPLPRAAGPPTGQGAPPSSPLRW